MKLDIINTDNTKGSSVELPMQFSEPVREDLIKRAVLVIQANKRQKYGADPEAGKRPSVRISKRRHDFRGTYGIGQSRTPRKVMSARGTRFNWEGAFAPQTVGGRRAHAPKAEKEWSLKINKKERHKAIRSALSAAMSPTLVKERGHIIPDNYPFIINNSFENVNKTKDLVDSLKKIGVGDDLARADVNKIRAGKGKMRGRRAKTRSSALIVTAGDCELLKMGGNIPGVEIVTVDQLNTELLAPGTMPGRLTLFTEGAIKTLADEKLFTEHKVKSESKVTKVKVEEKKTVKKAVAKKVAPKETKKAEEVAA